MKNRKLIIIMTLTGFLLSLTGIGISMASEEVQLKGRPIKPIFPKQQPKQQTQQSSNKPQVTPKQQPKNPSYKPKSHPIDRSNDVVGVWQ